MSYSSLLKDPPAALTPSAAVRPGMTTLGTLHHLRSRSTPKAPSPVSRTVDAISQGGVRDRSIVRRTARIRALQSCKRIISSSALSESIVQPKLQPVGLVYCASLRHVLDNLLHKFSCFLCPQLGIQILPAHRHDFGVPDTIWFRTQPAGLMWFDTYWDANLEKVSVITFSSVNFALISSNARAVSVLIWNCPQSPFVQRNRTIRSHKSNLPSSPACR